jgi:hypothetical protein
MIRDRKPVEENGDLATAKPQGFEKNAEFLRYGMWQQIGRLQAGRIWALR